MPKFLSSKSYPPEYSIVIPSCENGLEFNSRFENGNLGKAIKVSRTEYNLLVSEDYNTSGHYQWFYFKTKSKLPAGTAICFKILNMLKPTSLYPVGFKPFAFSLKNFHEKGKIKLMKVHLIGIGWQPVGTDISYNQNTIVRKKLFENKEIELGHFYSLSWKYTFEYSDDEVYFAQFPPYTFSNLLNYLKEIKERPGIEKILKMHVLCKTLGKNRCPMLTITENASTFLGYNYERLLASKSATTKSMVNSRVEKMREKLKTKRNVSKYKKSKTNEIITMSPEEGNITEILESLRQGIKVDSQFQRDHEMESI